MRPGKRLKTPSPGTLKGSLRRGALCLNCSSPRVNYCERHGLTGIGLDGYFETTSEEGYLCDDCGAFEEGEIQVEVEEGV